METRQWGNRRSMAGGKCRGLVRAYEPVGNTEGNNLDSIRSFGGSHAGDRGLVPATVGASWTRVLDLTIRLGYGSFPFSGMAIRTALAATNWSIAISTSVILGQLARWLAQPGNPRFNDEHKGQSLLHPALWRRIYDARGRTVEGGGSTTQGQGSSAGATGMVLRIVTMEIGASGYEPHNDQHHQHARRSVLASRADGAA